MNKLSDDGHAKRHFLHFKKRWEIQIITDENQICLKYYTIVKNELKLVKLYIKN